MATKLTSVIEKLENGQIKGGKAVKTTLDGLPPGRYKIEISRYQKSRSVKQNSVFHWYCKEIAEETGMAADIVKACVKKKFLTTDITGEDGMPVCDTATGEILQYIKDTSDLTTVEMMALCENLRLWAMEFFNLYLPLPNEETELKFK